MQKHMGKSLIILIALVSSLLAACSASDGEALMDNQWRLEQMVDDQGQFTELLGETEITAEFSEGQINGRAGCNNYFGGYTVSNGKIDFGNIAMTEMFCADPDGVMDQEGHFLKLLADVASFEISEDSLVMYSGSEEQLLTFVSVP